MQRAVAPNVMRIVWVALMAIFLVLIVTNQIAGFATSAFVVVILAVMGAEYALRRKK